MKSFIYTLTLVLGIVAVSFGQSGIVKGTVKDQKGNFVSGVSIRLKETRKGFSTPESGEFIFEKLHSQTYTLVASFVGYQTLIQTVKVEDGKTLTLELGLVEVSEELKEIVVRGSVSANEKPVEIGKMAIRPMDLPQSVATIDERTLKLQQVANLSDVLMNTNGVYIMGAAGGYQESIAARGFAFNSTNTFKNGVRFFNGMPMETSSLEKVEIMKGSAAILFGNVAAGGVLNLVTKKPKYDFGGEVSFKTGSFGLVKPSFDLYSGIGKNKTAAFRINGSYEKANSFREGVSSERFYVNPSILYNVGKKTTILLEGDYLKDQRTPDFGAGIINYQIVDLPRERFLGVSWSNYASKQYSSNITINHQLSRNWKLTGIAAYRYYETSLLANARPNSGTLIKADGTWIRNIQKTEVSDNYYVAQLDLKGTFTTGRIGHQLLAGFDTDTYTTVTDAYNTITGYDTLNILGTKQYKIRTDIPTMTIATTTSAPVNRVGAYVQDLLSISTHLKALVGVRYSYQQTISNVLTVKTNTTVSTANYDGALSPRLGLVYQPSKNHAVFASYSNSFTTNTGIDTSGNALKPSLIDQYELGIKNELLNGRLTANVTLYRIINDNLAQMSLAKGNTNTNIKELGGTVQSQGLELDFVARPFHQLSIMAGYSFNETKYLKSNTYVEGSLLLYNPKHTANLSANYHFEGKLKGLSLGLVGMYFGDRYAGRSTRTQINGVATSTDVYKPVALPAYTQLDATLGYSYKNISFRTKIGNITNVLSYNVHDDNSVNPIAPRNVNATLAVKF